MSGADFLDDRLDAEMDRITPCRDARTLAWLVTNLGADVLLAAIARTKGGSLGQRMMRASVRARIEELGAP